MSWFQFHKDKPVETPAPVDPAVQLQAEIDAQSENLRLASVAVHKAAEQVHKLEHEKAPLASDIEVLERRNDPSLAPKLQARKDAVASLDRQIEAANADLQRGQENFNQFHAAIEETKRQAATLNVEIDLAKVNEQGAAFQAQLKGYGTGAIPTALQAMQDKIRQSNAKASVDRAVSTNPNAAVDEECLKAGQ